MTNECINKMEKLILKKIKHIMRHIKSGDKLKDAECDIEWIKCISKELDMNDGIKNGIDIIEILMKRDDAGDLMNKFYLEDVMTMNIERLKNLLKEKGQHIKEYIVWRAQ